MIKTKLTIFLTIFYGSFLSASSFTVYWEGRILTTSEFSESALPAEIFPEAVISGMLTFDPEEYSTVRNITGTHVFGTRNIFESHLNQSFNIGQLEWNVEGGDISLIRDTSWLNRKAIDAFSTSQNSSFSSFPGFVGPYEIGIALFDNVEPFLLFNTYDIRETTFDLNAVSSASGFFTTRLSDGLGNIVDGYYVTFTIDTVSMHPIPEPSQLAIIAGLLCFVSALGLRRHVAEQRVTASSE